MVWLRDKARIDWRSKAAENFLPILATSVSRAGSQLSYAGISSSLAVKGLPHTLAVLIDRSTLEEVFSLHSITAISFSICIWPRQRPSISECGLNQPLASFFHIVQWHLRLRLYSFLDCSVLFPNLRGVILSSFHTACQPKSASV